MKFFRFPTSTCDTYDTSMLSLPCLSTATRQTTLFHVHRQRITNLDQCMAWSTASIWKSLFFHMLKLFKREETYVKSGNATQYSSLAIVAIWEVGGSSDISWNSTQIHVKCLGVKLNATKNRSRVHETTRYAGLHIYVTFFCVFPSQQTSLLS